MYYLEVIRQPGFDILFRSNSATAFNYLLIENIIIDKNNKKKNNKHGASLQGA